MSCKPNQQIGVLLASSVFDGCVKVLVSQQAVVGSLQARFDEFIRFLKASKPSLPSQCSLCHLYTMQGNAAAASISN